MALSFFLSQITTTFACARWTNLSAYTATARDSPHRISSCFPSTMRCSRGAPLAASPPHPHSSQRMAPSCPPDAAPGLKILTGGRCSAEAPSDTHAGASRQTQRPPCCSLPAE
eukprot:scaffold1398_cov259-Pinguiococcus_pyrenoidosus.AAC.6